MPNNAVKVTPDPLALELLRASNIREGCSVAGYKFATRDDVFIAAATRILARARAEEAEKVADLMSRFRGGKVRADNVEADMRNRVAELQKVIDGK